MHTRASSILCVLCSCKNHHENVFQSAERQRFDFPCESYVGSRDEPSETIRQKVGGFSDFASINNQISQSLFIIFHPPQMSSSILVEKKNKPARKSSEHFAVVAEKKASREKSFSNTFENIGITLNQNSKIAFIATAGTLERNSRVFVLHDDSRL